VLGANNSAEIDLDFIIFFEFTTFFWFESIFAFVGPFSVFPWLLLENTSEELRAKIIPATDQFMTPRIIV